MTAIMTSYNVTLKRHNLCQVQKEGQRVYRSFGHVKAQTIHFPPSSALRGLSESSIKYYIIYYAICVLYFAFYIIELVIKI